MEKIIACDGVELVVERVVDAQAVEDATVGHIHIGKAL